jgi:uncharacterized protein
MKLIQPLANLNPIATRAVEPSDPNAIVGGRVELNLFTTLACNLKCTYCSESDVIGSQAKVTYSMDQLDKFIKSNLGDREVYVTFYGGEPTLNIDFMDSVMTKYPNYRFNLQTNGTLLHRLSDQMLSRLSNVLVSVDGGKVITDGFRGKGVYQRVLNKTAEIRSRLGGTLTARVTWGSADTTFEELDQLLESFDYVYWQFVCAEGEYHEAALSKKRLVITQLVDRFFSGDALYRVIPIMGIVRNKVLPNRATELYAGQTQCRASTHILNILPDGTIFPCPDMTDNPDMQQGSVVDNWLKKSPLQQHDDMPGGCLTRAKFYGPDGRRIEG